MPQEGARPCVRFPGNLEMSPVFGTFGTFEANMSGKIWVTYPDISTSGCDKFKGVDSELSICQSCTSELYDLGGNKRI